MRKTKLRSERGAGVTLLLVAAIIVVVVILVAFVASPWMNRDGDYANDPTNPPDDVDLDTDGDGDIDDDDEVPEPLWQGRFAIPITITWSESQAAGRAPRVTDVSLGACKMGADGKMVKYDGQPWKPWKSLAWYDFDTPDKVDIKYNLTIDNGKVTLTYKGTDTVKKQANWFSNVKTGWWFFWEEHEDIRWSWTLKVTCEGKSISDSGDFRINALGSVS